MGLEHNTMATILEFPHKYESRSDRSDLQKHSGNSRQSRNIIIFPGIRQGRYEEKNERYAKLDERFAAEVELTLNSLLANTSIEQNRQ